MCIAGLCDSISTSDDYLLQLTKAEGTEVFKVKYNMSRKQSVMQKLLQEQDDDEVSAVDNTSYIADTLAQIIAKTISQVAWEGDGGRVQVASTEKKH